MKTAVFDTNIVIDALNGLQAADDEYLLYKRVFVSLITWIEVMVGAEQDDQTAKMFMQNSFTILPITQEVAERAVLLRQERRIKLPDAIIQATAQVHHAVLVTRNSKDFPEGTAGVRLPYQL